MDSNLAKFFRKVGIIGCVGIAIIIAGWRLMHPPITERMEEELAEGDALIRECRFHWAYETYRRAAALDGTAMVPKIKMELALIGRRDFDRYRRYGKGCNVSRPESYKEMLPEE